MLIDYHLILSTIREVGTSLILAKIAVIPANTVLGIPEREEINREKTLPGYLADNLTQVAIENGTLQSSDLIAFVAAHALPELDEDHRILYNNKVYKIRVSQIINHRGEKILYKLNLLKV